MIFLGRNFFFMFMKVVFDTLYLNSPGVDFIRSFRYFSITDLQNVFNNENYEKKTWKLLKMFLFFLHLLRLQNMMVNDFVLYNLFSNIIYVYAS